MADPENGGETLEQVKAKLAEAETKLASATGELVENRTKRQVVEGERDALKLKVEELTKAPPAAGDPAALAEQATRKVLAERDADSAKTAETTAITLFTARYKEFAPENDQGGVKLSAVMARYKDFSKEGKKSEAEFLKLLEDSYTLVNPTRSVNQGTTYAPFASTPSNPGSPQDSAGQSKLTPEERSIVTRMGWTEEQFLKQKEKRPNYIKSLLQYAK